ncbi:ribonuclease H-like domain-containing protein [uncultured Ezakiella sp.]|uniref:ribonuclease H-like domain-containing protein n=1 Tax=uncultured Ezakiella sp. TaxID=1637529 RepID=UPI0025F4FC01|nr:ribonuclease H-like domain-containing protein [uncultured Ezakiella sp.]
MDLIEYTDSFSPNGYAHSKDLYLDIETTGVRRYADFAWCIGYSYIKNNEIHSKQLLLNNSSDELASLSLLQHEMDRFDRIVTFNGDVFDLPFLYKRAISYGMELNFPKERVDLYKLLRANKKFMMLDKINLKTAEILAGIDRDDNVTGYETIKLYEEVVRTGDESKRDLLLKHNYYDIRNLPLLMKIFLPIKNARTIDIGDQSFFVNDFNVVGDSLEVRISSKYESIQINYYDDFVAIDGDKHEIIIRFKIKTALKDGKIISYLAHNNRVFQMDKLFYPIIKEEVTGALGKICK